MAIPNADDAIPPVHSAEALLTVFDGLVTEPPRKRGFAPLLLLLPGRGATSDVPERIVAGLRARCVDSEGRPLAPVALWLPREAEPGDPDSRTADSGEQVGFYQELVDGLSATSPPDIGRIKFRDYTLMRTVLESRLTQLGAEAKAGQLREVIHRARFPARPSAPPREELREVLPWFGQLLLWVWSLVAQPVTSWRVNRMMMRGWFPRWARSALGAAQRNFFRPATQLTRGGALHTREHVDAVLTRALLADVERAFRRRWISPWRRRRTTRFVLLLNEESDRLGPSEPPHPAGTGPSGGGQGWPHRDGVRGFLAAYTMAVAQERTTGTVVVASVAEEAAEELGVTRAEPSALSDTLTTGLDGPLRACAVCLSPDPGASPAAEHWLRAHPKLPDRSGPFRSPARAAVSQWTAVAVCGALLYVGLGQAGVPLPLAPTDDRCPDGQFEAADKHGCLGLSDGSERFAGSMPDYDGLMKMIKRTNDEVEALDQNHQVRTVVVFQPFTAGNSNVDLMEGGVLPELQGIALMQAEILREAKENTRNVAVRLLLANSGPRFEEAESVAKLVVKRARDEKIVGAIGFGQSLVGTQEAIEVFADASIPVIGTSATADNLVRKELPYYQIAPTNQRAAEAAASFLQHEKFVGIQNGKKTKAEAAVIVYDSGDLYSKNLAADVKEEFSAEVGDQVELIEQQNANQLAGWVCDRVLKQPATVVFWADRAGDMNAFLNEYRQLRDCKGRVTILAGDDLTNSLVKESDPVNEYGGLTLHHMAHAVPGIHAVTTEAKRYVTVYERRFKGKDSLINDGHPALGWDALKVLSYAVNRARDTGAGGAEFDRTAVSTALRSGKASLEGATGVLNFHVDGESVQVPPDKPIFVIKDTPMGPQVALECGHFGADAQRTSWGGAGERYPCPRD